MSKKIFKKSAEQLYALIKSIIVFLFVLIKAISFVLLPSSKTTVKNRYENLLKGIKARQNI